MKKTTVQISFEAEKLRAIHCYLKGEEALGAGMEAVLQSLYEEHVPEEVRENIESWKPKKE